MSVHPGIDMMTFTGSTRAGIAVAKASADTVKRVTQELGGKSANIVLDDADIEKAVAQGVNACFTNSGQSCNAPTRMFVPRAMHARAVAAAKAAAEGVKVGDALDRKSTRLNSSHSQISYAVFCLKKKKNRKHSRNNKQRSRTC